MDGRAQQQRRDRREVTVAVAVGQDDEPGAAGDGRRDLGEDRVEAGLECRSAAVHGIQTLDDDRRITGQVAVGVDPDDLGEFVVVENREVEDELPGVRGCR